MYLGAENSNKYIVEVVKNNFSKEVEFCLVAARFFAFKMASSNFKVIKFGLQSLTSLSRKTKPAITPELLSA